MNENPGDLPPATSFRYVLRDDLPDGKILMGLESTEDGTIVAIREGHMSPELVTKMNEFVAGLIATGVWRRHM